METDPNPKTEIGETREKQIWGKKIVRPVLEGVAIFGDRPLSNNRNRRDSEKNILREKIIFRLVLEGVTIFGDRPLSHNRKMRDSG